MERPLAIAHRAGNSLSRLRTAEGLGADIIEADLHLFHGEVEVRHEKTIGPIPIFWERWRLIRPPTPRMRLQDLLAAVAPSTHLMLDLKGPSPRLSRLTLEAMQRLFADRHYTVCARNWMLLRPFEGLPGVRAIRSIGGLLQLQCLLRGRRRSFDGVSIDQRLLTAEVARELSSRTDLLLAWDVTTDERVRELFALGVNGFILEEATLLRSIRESPGDAPTAR